MKNIKKRCLAFLLCLHTILYMLFQMPSVVMAEDDTIDCAPVVEEMQNSEVNGSEIEDDELLGSDGEVLEIENKTTTEIEENQILVINEEGDEPGSEPEIETEPENGNTLEWISYSDYRNAERDRTWNNPELFIGTHAIFDLSLGTFYVSSGLNEAAKSIKTMYVEASKFADSTGKSIEVIITDYAKDENGSGVWFEVMAAEGYELPEIMEQHPYVWHMAVADDMPVLHMAPVKGMFAVEEIYVQQKMNAAEKGVKLQTVNLPDFFEVIYVSGDGLDWYDLGDITSWSDTITVADRYISAYSVILVPAEVSGAYDRLMNADGTAEYNEILSQLPEGITSQFTSVHISNLEKHFEDLYISENVEYTEMVMLGDVEVPVTVHGKLPQEGVKLTVHAVTAEAVMNEGFDIKDESEIITALDIKIIKDEDGTEWQPDEGEKIWVSIGMKEFGYEDGSILQLHHKHGDDIDKYEIFVVIDGKVTVGTYGFSTYVVTSTDEETGTQIGTNVTLTVGQEVIYYIKNLSIVSGRNTYAPDFGNWFVTDLEGAIYYEVHSNDTIGHDGMLVPWIKIVALKETSSPITLEFKYGRNNNDTNYSEVHYLEIVSPKATTDAPQKLYIKDEVNTSGRITATLVDVDGNEIENGLDGAAFTWKRMDGSQDMFIMPQAYEQDNRSINIAKDHGGLLESKREKNAAGEIIPNGDYVHTEYEVTAILSDGTVLSDKYTVYYQSEIINASFEAPPATAHTYTFFPNGWAGMYWKTTGPGSGKNLTRDIEYVDFEPNQNGRPYNSTSPAFGVASASDGDQFAELNAEAFGTLYQDIITVPDEEVAWKFSHAARQNYHNEMYIVLGPTEAAQKLTTQRQLEELAQAARQADTNNKLGSNECVNVTYDGAEYSVWYHEATDNGLWEMIEGTYIAKQYRTRVFFMSQSQSQYQNYGNLIDTSRVGQYKSYLIEYYTETFVDGEKKTVYLGSEPIGEALLYSSVPLEMYEEYLSQNYYLHKILINNSNYPYNIRYADDESLFIDKYNGTAVDPLTGLSDKYNDYEIVMQVFFRDTIIAVQKELEFPTTLTAEQKLKIIEDLNKSTGGSYKASFHLYTKDGGATYSVMGDVPITHRDPTGEYTGYLSLGENPPLGNDYYVEETGITDIIGLELDTVTFSTTLYKYGEENKPEEVHYDEITVDGKAVELKSSLIPLVETKKIAEVVVTNTYKEKTTTVYYKAVGNGKVALAGQTDFADTPTETLAFYSGKSKGAEIHVGTGASFDGWYKDEACTIPVTSTDGVYNSTDGSFKPNANIISTEKITFYAKFVTGTIRIERTNAEPNQIFVYRVTGGDLDIYVTLVCDKNGNGVREIYEVPLNTLNSNIIYTVTEQQNWSWRYGDSSVSKENAINPTTKVVVFSFDGESNKTSWLNGMISKKNIFKGGS